MSATRVIMVEHSLVNQTRGRPERACVVPFRRARLCAGLHRETISAATVLPDAPFGRHGNVAHFDEPARGLGVLVAAH